LDRPRDISRPAAETTAILQAVLTEKADAPPTLGLPDQPDA
jgi:hypothetical protein